MVAIKSFALPLAATGFAAAQSGLRYMPFGDSITEIVCWRSLLWEKFQSTEWSDVNWVGSKRTDQNCNDNRYDRDHEGHSGYLAIDVANKRQLVGWLQRNPADVITMHMGTNDIYHQRKSAPEIIAAFTTLVNDMRNSNPKIKIVVAKIIPLTTSWGNFGPLVDALNAAIPNWARGMSTVESPIWVVDQFTGYGQSDNRDGIHPSASGDRKMADRWYPALVEAFAAANATKYG